jgi:HlyD family secretion protein
MADLGVMQVRTLVDETDMGDVRSGMATSVTVEAYPGRPFAGLVEKVEPQAVVEQSVTMFPVIVQLDNRSGLLRPGMNAEVEILINEAPGVLLIPNNAVVTLQDATAAAAVLGLDPQDIDIRSLFSNRAGRGEDRAQGERGARPGNSEAEPGNTNRPRGPMAAEADSLRSKVQRGEISQDSARVLILNMRQRQGRDAENPTSAEISGSISEQRGNVVSSRQGIVFKIMEDGSIGPQLVQLGLNDWDFTEVVSGLNVGDQLAVVGAAQLRAGQDEFLNRIRSRSGGGMFGGGR